MKLLSSASLPRSLILSFLCLAACMADGMAQGLLNNGQNHPGEISVPLEIQEWTFEAASNDSISLSAADVGDDANVFWPWIRLKGPDGTVIKNQMGVAVAQIDHMATQTGAYTVLIGSNSGQGGNPLTGVGKYQLTLAKTPGNFVVSPTDEGGAMTNGANHAGKIHLGDLDQWTFEATANDTISLSVGEVEDISGFWPWIRLLAPNGTVIGSHQGAEVAYLDHTATQSGTYTVLIGSNSGQSGSPLNGVGAYVLTLARTPSAFIVSPGDEGGPLTNGANHAGEIRSGDLDQWTFEATANDSISLTAGDVNDASGFWPWMRLRGPDGTQVDEHRAGAVAQINHTAVQTGTYTVLIGSNSGQGGTPRDGAGSYMVRLALVPEKFSVSANDEGGRLSVDQAAHGAVDLGDLDMWLFAADAGGEITITAQRVGETGTLNPLLRLYDSHGMRVDTRTGATQAQIVFSPAVSCFYTLIISDGSVSGAGTGAYELTTTGLPDQNKQLRPHRTGPGTMNICWPYDLAGYVLQKNPILQAEGWVDVPDLLPSNNGLNFDALISTESDAQFFRLRPPAP